MVSIVADDPTRRLAARITARLAASKTQAALDGGAAARNARRLVLQNSTRETWIELAQICGDGRLSGGLTHENTINPGLRWGCKVGWLNGRRRLLVKIPALCASWPAELKIKQATLEMAAYEATGMAGAPIAAHQMWRDWRAGSVTWNRCDVTRRAKWQSSGASGRRDRAADVLAAVQLDSPIKRGATRTWLSWDVTELAQAWVSGEETNRGILLVSLAAEESGKASPRSEHLVRLHPNTDSAHNRDPALRPRLILRLESNGQGP